MKAKSDYRHDIQILRGISIIVVLLYHFNDSLFPNGYLGVDVFFVISGFVITPLVLRITDTDNLNNNGKDKFNQLKFFYKQRFYRLAPALAVTLVLSGFLILILGPVYDHKRFSIQGFATLILGGNLSAIKYSQDYFSPYPNPLIHTWSLSVEEQIYLIIPFVFIVAAKCKRRSRLMLILALFIISLISILFFLIPANLNKFSNLTFSNPESISFYSPISRIWQFCTGSITYLIYQNIKIRSVRTSNYFKIITIVLFLLIIFSPITRSIKFNSLAVTIFSSLIIYSKWLEINIPFLRKVLIWFGDRSYSLYLIHMPLIYIAKYSPYIQTNSFSNLSWPPVIALSITLILSSLSYSLIENRYRLKSASYFSFKTRNTLVKFWLMPLVIFIAMIAFSNNYNFRGLPPENKNSSYNWDKNCQVLSDDNHLATTPCTYEKYKATKNILLIGDSHAAAQSKAIVTAGNSQNFNVYVFTYSGCPFLVNTDQLALTNLKIDKNCLKHNQLITQFIAEKKPDLVMYSQRSTSLYAPNFGDNDYQVNFLNQVLRNIENLQNSNTKVLIIGPNPEIVIPSTLIDYILKNKPSWNPIPFENNYWLIDKLALGSIQYLDTLSIFCTSDTNCESSLEKSGKKVWLFEDLNHLSIEGSLKLVPSVVNILNSIFSR
jgi:peptidoglycan/LPS O-acetylase OafA/YrhL